MPLADGCRHVFLDVGSNRGVHVRFLYEPDQFPGASFNKYGFFRHNFGTTFANDSTVCAFGFEPNPAHATRLQKLGMSLRARGHRAEWIQAAVSNRTGELIMYNDRSEFNRNHSDWTFSASPVSPRGTQMTDADKVRVPRINFGAFLREEIVPRKLPSAAPQKQHGQQGHEQTFPPSIVMKLDVEGAELEVLQSMLDYDVLCHVSLIAYEPHPWAWTDTKDAYYGHQRLWKTFFEGSSRPADWNHTSGIRKIRKFFQAHHPGKMPVRPPGASPACKTRFAAKDDESYLLVSDAKMGSWW